MKKTFVIALLFASFATQTGTAQSKNQDKTISITVKEVEYDDPAFESLRKSIKGNMKAKNVSPGFTEGNATISLSYQGNATELWDELPQSIKQNFKITGIDDTHISLQLKTVSKQIASSTETKKDDCVNCYYYKNCRVDTSYNLNGQVFKGTKSKAGTYLYYCDKGMLYSTYKNNNNTYIQTIFKANEPVGTSWADTSESGSLYKHVTISKGIGIRYGINDYYYADVMIVYGNYGSSISNYYYAKDWGFIKSDSVGKDFNPAIAATMKGIVDTTLIGLWKYYNPVNRTNTYYKFNGDGTFAYYNGSVSPYAQMPPGISYWRANGNNLELYNGAWNNVSTVAFRKKNDPVSGKPAIVFGDEKNSLYYLSDSEKPLWK